jgi:methylmalonyl-CoA/ethylmalonyl-CoA epimerase
MSEQTAAQPAAAQDGFAGETVQVAFVASDLERGLDNLVALGIGPFQVFTIGPDNCRDLEFRGRPSTYSIRVAFAVQGAMMWEVIQPLDGESLFTEALAAGHEGLHHVAIDCGGIPVQERIAGLERRGYEVLTRGAAFDGQVPFAYLHNGDRASPFLEVFSFPEGFAPTPEAWYPAPPDGA